MPETLVKHVVFMAKFGTIVILSVSAYYLWSKLKANTVSTGFERYRHIRQTNHVSNAESRGGFQMSDQPNLLELKEEITRFYKTVQCRVSKTDNTSSEPDEVQIELGQWINILSEVYAQVSDLLSNSPRKRPGFWRLRTDQVDPADMFARVRLAVTSLLSPNKNLKLVQEMRYSIENDLVGWNGGWFQRAIMRLSGGSPTMTVVWGSVCTLIVGALILMAIPWLSNREFLYIEHKIILGTAVPAFLGAIVSILSRLQEFGDARGVDPKLLFMTAFFKPYIGMISGIFIVSAFAIGIGSLLNGIELIPNDQPGWPPPKVIYFLYVVGFLSGYSERFIKDFIGAAADRLAPKDRPK
jgi:hypothetical protein